MRAPLSWLREYAALPDDLDGRTLAEALISAGPGGRDRRPGRGRRHRSARDRQGAGVRGRGPFQRQVDPLVPGRCRVRTTTSPDRGASSAARTTSRLATPSSSHCPAPCCPAASRIAARKTYGHVSDGMICSAKELGLGDDHSGILVLDEPGLVPGADAAPVLHLRDDVLDIAVTPDRGYCLSMRGIWPASRLRLSASRSPIRWIAQCPPKS